jgi:hypothetical protein
MVETSGLPTTALDLFFMGGEGAQNDPLNPQTC